MKYPSFRPQLLLKSIGTRHPLLHVLLPPRRRGHPQVEPLTEAAAAAQEAGPWQMSPLLNVLRMHARLCPHQTVLRESWNYPLSPSILLRQTLPISTESQKLNPVITSTLPLNIFLYIRQQKTIPNLKMTFLLLPNLLHPPSNPYLPILCFVLGVLQIPFLSQAIPVLEGLPASATPSVRLSHVSCLQWLNLFSRTRRLSYWARSPISRAYFPAWNEFRYFAYTFLVLWYLCKIP